MLLVFFLLISVALPAYAMERSVKSASSVLQIASVSSAAISAGGNHSLALKSDGTVYAWGWNQFGQLGDGTMTDRTTPVQVSGLSGVTAISAGGNHSLALKSDGTVWAWGWNSFGQLGDGTITTNRLTPVQVSGLSGITAIAAGGEHSLALKQDGTVWAWGNNSFGQLGDGTTLYRPTPVQVSNLSGITAIEAGDVHSLALKQDSTVWAWGDNSFGQLGDGTTTERHTPVQVSGLTGATAIATGRGYSLALKQDGTVWAWGVNTTGALGEGPVWAWAYNVAGQLGDGTLIERHTPVQVKGLTNITAIEAGTVHSLALKQDGTVWAWGGVTSMDSSATVPRLKETPRLRQALSLLHPLISLTMHGIRSTSKY